MTNYGLGTNLGKTVDLNEQAARKVLEEDIVHAISEIKGETVIAYDEKKLAAAADYAAEDVLSESATDGAGTAFKFNIGKGLVRLTKAIAFCSVTALTPRVTLYLSNSPPTSEKDDNAANTAPSHADWQIFEGQLDFLGMEDLGGGSSSVITVGTYGNLPLDVVAGVDGYIYGIAVTRDAITGEAAGMLLGFKLVGKRI